jgi:hypothetical protein
MTTRSGRLAPALIKAIPPQHLPCSRKYLPPSTIKIFVPEFAKISGTLKRYYDQQRNEVAYGCLAQVNILNDFAFYLPNPGVCMGVLSRHKSLILDLSSSSVIANDKIYYAISAIHF